MLLSLQRTLSVRQIGVVKTFHKITGSSATDSGIDQAAIGSIDHAEGEFKLNFKERGQQDIVPVNMTAITPNILFQCVASDEESLSIEAKTTIIIAAIKALKEIQDLTFTADTAGAAGNGISVAYTAGSSKSALVVQDITYTMLARGIAGDAKQIEYLNTALAGAEVATLVGNKISVAMEDGVSTATQIRAALLAVPAIVALMSFPITGTAGDAQDAAAAANLTGGGLVLASVIGTVITVGIESGVNTATEIKTAMDLVAGIAALVDITITGVGATPQVIQAATLLEGGVKAYAEGDKIDADFYLSAIHSTRLQTNS